MAQCSYQNPNTRGRGVTATSATLGRRDRIEGSIWADISVRVNRRVGARAKDYARLLILALVGGTGTTITIVEGKLTLWSINTTC